MSSSSSVRPSAFSSLHPFFCWCILTKDTNTPWTPSTHQLLPDNLAAAPPEPNHKHTLSELLFPLRRNFFFRFTTSLGNFWATLPRRRPEHRTVRRMRDSPSLRGETSNLCPHHPGLNQARSRRVFWAGHVRQVQRTQTETQLSGSDSWVMRGGRVIHLGPVDTINRMLCVWF